MSFEEEYAAMSDEQRARIHKQLEEIRRMLIEMNTSLADSLQSLRSTRGTTPSPTPSFTATATPSTDDAVDAVAVAICVAAAPSLGEFPTETNDGCEVDDSASKPPASSPASAITLSTSSPPDGVPATHATTMSALVVSTAQDDSGKLVTMPAALTSASSTPSTETSNGNPILIPKQPQAAPTKCSMSGLCHIACAPELAATTLPPLTASPDSVPPEDTHAGMLVGVSLQFLNIGVCKSQLEFEGNFSCNLLIAGSIRSEQCCMKQKPPWLLFSEIPIFWLGLQQTWPPPILVEIWGCNSDVRPAPWPSLDCCSIEAQMISPWPPPAVLKTLVVSLTTACIVEEFSNPICVFACCNISQKSWPPPEQGLLMLHQSISCVSAWQITVCATVHFYLEICMCNKHWLEILENAVQIDACSRTLVAELLQLPLHHQIGLFTCALVADKVTLFNFAFYLVLCLWRKDQINFPRLPPYQEKCRLYMTSALVAVISNIRIVQSYMPPKPSWQLCSELSLSRFEMKQLEDGFLLETSPWLVFNLDLTLSNSSHMPEVSASLDMDRAITVWAEWFFHDGEVWKCRELGLEFLVNLEHKIAYDVVCYLFQTAMRGTSRTTLCDLFTTFNDLHKPWLFVAEQFDCTSKLQS